jgi:hypothetical protein
MYQLLEGLDKLFRRGAFVSLIVGAAIAASPTLAAADEPEACAWPFVGTPEGLGNILWPDNASRYPFMLFDSDWKEMTITGDYPEARYMSYTIYYWTNFETDEVGDHLFDAQIIPDRGSVNPFGPAEDKRATPLRKKASTYTITVTREEDAKEETNVLRVTDEPPWVILRIYLPDIGKNFSGGVSLPTVTVTDWDGTTSVLKPCDKINEFDDLNSLIPQLFLPGFEIPDIPDPASDRLWLYPINPVPAYIGPNPDNKYVGVFGLDLQPGRVVVIRGKAPGFPDTYFGSPISEPAPGFDDVQLRYWSLCHNDLVLPLPVVQCVADLQTQLDEKGYYTYVISSDLFAPEWVPPDVTWIPWGDEFMPKLIALRNMLPAADFEQTAQAAIDAGCSLPPPFSSELVPTPGEVKKAGRCTRRVMGEYYPEAVWCDEQVFIEKGWRGCFRAAKIR